MRLEWPSKRRLASAWPFLQPFSAFPRDLWETRADRRPLSANRRSSQTHSISNTILMDALGGRNVPQALGCYLVAREKPDERIAAQIH